MSKGTPWYPLGFVYIGFGEGRAAFLPQRE